LVATLTTAAAIGDLVVVYFGAKVAARTYTVADNAVGTTNVWTVVELNSANASAGSSGCMAYCVLTTAIPIAKAVTATVNTGTPGGRSVYAFKVLAANLAASPADKTLADTQVLNNTTGTFTMGSTLTQVNELVVAHIGCSVVAAEVITAAAGWTTNANFTHSGTTTQANYVASKVVEATTAPSIAPTVPTATDDWCGAMVSFKLLTVSGTAAGTVSFTGAATGTVTNHQVNGTAAGTVTFTGAGAGTVTHHQYLGTAAGTVSFTGAGAGTVTHHQYSGTAAGTVTFTGAAVGTVTAHAVQGTAAGTVSFTGAATGTVTRHAYVGTGAGTVTWTGHGTGSIISPAVNGTAAGTVSFVGVARGNGQLPPTIIYPPFDPWADLDPNFR
jgi:hypothetical protein